MFSIVWGEILPGHKCGKHASIKWENSTVCALNTWAFSSCACFSIHDFSNYSEALNSKENVNAFFEFLNSKECDDSWIPTEIFFLLTETQLKLPWGKRLTSHEHVKLRDKFTNKSHGGRTCYLFRYSLEDDFHENS